MPSFSAGESVRLVALARIKASAVATARSPAHVQSEVGHAGVVGFVDLRGAHLGQFPT